MKMKRGAQSQKHNVSGQIRKPFSSPVESHDSTCMSKQHGENAEFMSSCSDRYQSTPDRYHQFLPAKFKNKNINTQDILCGVKTDSGDPELRLMKRDTRKNNFVYFSLFDP